MTEQALTLTRHDLEAKIVKRCWEDEDFRKEFIADPGAAFTRYLPVPAGSLPRIVIHEEGPGSWHIVLPARPASVSELSEEELERVAGATPLPSLGYVLYAPSMHSLHIFQKAGVVSIAASAAGTAIAGSGAAVSAVLSVEKGW
jgi:hypothetical protein